MIGFSKNTYLIACNSYIYLFSLYGRTIVDHIGRRRGCLHDVSRSIDDTLGKIGRVGHHPLRFRREADKEAAHTQHDDFLFPDFVTQKIRIL